MYFDTWIRAFVEESNRIEGIAFVDELEVVATKTLMGLNALALADIVALVNVYERGAQLRNCKGLDVFVGRYTPPLGGPEIEAKLRDLLETIPSRTPWETHVEYEMLHPFTDGNGRSGRAIWVWDMRKRGLTLRLPFLHHFYYQTLEAMGRKQ